MNPIKAKMYLPQDCSDLLDFEWTEPATVTAPKPKRSFADFQKSLQAAEILPAPIKFKSLAESFSELVAAVRSFRRPANPLTAALSGK
jgi:hypothetical protein